VDEPSSSALRRAIRDLHGCESTFAEFTPVVDRMPTRPRSTFGGERTLHGEIVWRGNIAIFELAAHPSASRCYAWSYEPRGGTRKYFAVLHQPPVTSPVLAVRAAIYYEP
jgi:hypothetical protein